MRRLIEVGYPIRDISRVSSYEKKLVGGFGNRTSVHVWWTRRTLSYCRSVLMGLLLPDPCDVGCPGGFRERAVEVLRGLYGFGVESFEGRVRTAEGLREELLRFVAGVSEVHAMYDHRWLMAANELVRAAHGRSVLVVDPFSGGGSIPSEALRLGFDAYSSDLNPVSCFLQRVLLDKAFTYTPGLLDKLRIAISSLRDQLEASLRVFYPRGSSGLSPLHYIWCFTVRCDGCGVEVPLMRSYWLCDDPKSPSALRVVGVEDGVVQFEVFSPSSSDEVPGFGFYSGRARCVVCGHVMDNNRVREQIRRCLGKVDVVFDEDGRRVGGARLMAVYVGEKGFKRFRDPSDEDYRGVFLAQRYLNEILAEWNARGKPGICPIPDEGMTGSGGNRLRGYGLKGVGDFFTSRQKVSLFTLASLIKRKDESLWEDLAIVFDRIVHGSTMLCGPGKLNNCGGVLRGLNRPVMPFWGEFAEVVPYNDTMNDFLRQGSRLVDYINDTFKLPYRKSAKVCIADASNHPLPDGSADVWFTDPPYYDYFIVSDASDIFFAWLKRLLPGHPLLKDPFDPSNPLTPKEQEMVVLWGKSYDFYTKKFTEAMSEGSRILRKDGIGALVFTHLDVKAWKSVVESLIQSKLEVTASWPAVTELESRLFSVKTISLDVTITLVLRKRETDKVEKWENVKKEMREEIRYMSRKLIDTGIYGSNLDISLMGYSIKMFTKYSSIIDEDGRCISVDVFFDELMKTVKDVIVGELFEFCVSEDFEDVKSDVIDDVKVVDYVFPVSCPAVEKWRRHICAAMSIAEKKDNKLLNKFIDEFGEGRCEFFDVCNGLYFAYNGDCLDRYLLGLFLRRAVWWRVKNG